MAKQNQILERQIAKMKLGETITVNTESERQRASKSATALRRAGIVEFVLKTYAKDGKFILEAA